MSAASAIPDPGLAPTPPGSTQAFFLWAPLHWDDRCTHFGVFEDANANRWHTDGAVLPVYSSPADIPGAEDPDIELLANVEHEIDYLPGTRRAGHAAHRAASTPTAGARTSTSSRSSASA